MPRPGKPGLDYFPLDVALDSKFELIEAEFGLTGFAVVVKLYQKIYGEQGYYCEWTEEVALLFGKRSGLGGNVVSEIVEASIKRGIFDRTQYERNHILTSSGIQKRYLEAVSRRKAVEVKEQYLLVSHALLPDCVSINPENVNRNSKNECNNSQSKGKKRNLCADFDRFWAAYPKKKSKADAQKAFEKLAPGEELLSRMLSALEQQKQSGDWQREGGQYIPYPASWLNGRRWEDEESPTQNRRNYFEEQEY